MLSIEKKFEPKCLKLSSYTNGVLSREYTLDKKRILLGRFTGADISIDSQHISNYHAFIIIDNDGGGKVIDLDSANGIFVNGKKQSTSYFSSGDVLRFGDIEFQVLEHNDHIAIKDEDANAVIKMDDVYKAPPPKLVPIENLAIIDGEYCNIEFNEKESVENKSLALLNCNFDFSDYVDTSIPSEYIPVFKEQKHQSVEVSILSNGHIISIDYFPLKNRTYYISADTISENTVLLDCLQIHGRAPLVTVKKDKIKLFKIHGFDAVNLTNNSTDPFGNNEVFQCTPNDIISFGHKTIQVIVRITNSPPHLRSAPFWGRDRKFQVHMTKYMSLFMSLGILLLFVDIQPYSPPPEKAVSVVYREAEMPKEQLIPRNLQPQPESGDQPVVTQPTEKRAEAPPAIAAPPKAASSKPQKESSGPVEQVEGPGKPMKAYAFKMNKSLTSFFSSQGPSVAKVNIGKTGPGISNSTFSTSDVNMNNSRLVNSKNKAGNGKMGDDFSGSYDRSSGTKGIASKNGFDTAYIEPKTVVLGSMDPEVLRKILKDYLPQFRHCYNEELMEHSDAVQGTVDLMFTIGKDGKVTNLKLGSKSIKFSQRGTNCMANALKVIDFPKPKSGGVVDVRQPLNFSSENTNN